MGAAWPVTEFTATSCAKATLQLGNILARLVCGGLIGRLGGRSMPKRNGKGGGS